jgi:hypothetical protein
MAGYKGAGKSGPRPLEGRFSSKIHIKTDFDGLPVAFHLTSDTTQLEISLEIEPDITPRVAITDKSDDPPAQPCGLPPTRHNPGHTTPRERQGQTQLLLLGKTRARVSPFRLIQSR